MGRTVWGHIKGYFQEFRRTELSYVKTVYDSTIGRVIPGVPQPPSKTEKQVEQLEKFDEQCFLIDNWQLMKRWIKDDYSNFIMITGKDPRMVVHHVLSKNKLDPLLSITPLQKSLLVPKVKLYKINYPTEDSKGEEYELFFDDHVTEESVEKMMNNFSGKGNSVGLSSFSYDMVGKDIAEGGSVEAEIKIYFQSHYSFLTPSDDVKKRASFLDLIVPQARQVSKEIKDPIKNETITVDRQWNPKYFILKAVVGWAIPSDPEGIIVDDKLRDALERSNTTLILILSEENMDFKQTGEMELTIKYRSFIDGVFTNQKSDLFYITENGVQAEQLNRKLINSLSKRKDPKIKEKLAKTRNQEDVVIDSKNIDSTAILRRDILLKSAEDEQSKYSRIVDYLLKNGSIYYTLIDQKHVSEFKEELNKDVILYTKDGKEESSEFTEEEIKGFNLDLRAANRRKNNIEIYKLNYESKRDTLISKTISAIQNVSKVNKELLTSGREKYSKTSQEEKQKTINNFNKLVSEGSYTKTKDVNKRKINFFFYGDLIDCVLSVLNNNPESKNIRVILGPMIFEDPRTKKLEIVNLADIPISLTLFLTWYINMVVAKNRKSYLLKQFLEDSIRKLIIPALGENCFRGKQKLDLSTVYFSLPGIGKDGKEEPIPRKRGRLSVEEIKNIDLSGNSKFSKMYNYLFIYVTSYKVSLSEKRVIGKGNYKEDREKNIYHLYVGGENGLVKDINFRRISDPLMAAMRVTADTDKNNLARSRYNCTIRMIGNPIFYPGQIIFVDTTPMGFGSPNSSNSLSRRIGFGGYYSVNKISNILDKDNYETVLDCIFVGFGEGGTDKKTPFDPNRVKTTNEKTKSKEKKIDER